ncbi:MAG: hypothetical protein JXA50_03690 [Deltaproteobacteria bacterium]|nr:hypothetical protein [Deltaproteobacteria bacterium]
MKRLLLVFTFLVFVLSACAGHVNYIRENPDRLSPGLKAKAFLKAWGEPDEQLSYHNFLNKYGLRVSDQVEPHVVTGSGSEYGQRSHYTHETLVWIYKKQQKILFFEKGYLVYDAPGSLEVVWRLVGWETLSESPQSGQKVKSLESPERDHQRETTYKITYEDGSKYLGGILDGKRHGQGTYTWPSGDKYVGEWINNRAIGGWFYKTTGRKLWVYQDSEGKWIVK